MFYVATSDGFLVLSETKPMRVTSDPRWATTFDTYEDADQWGGDWSRAQLERGKRARFRRWYLILQKAVQDDKD